MILVIIVLTLLATWFTPREFVLYPPFIGGLVLLIAISDYSPLWRDVATFVIMFLLFGAAWLRIRGWME